MANIIIVGGGVAGLSAGIYAQMSGHHATIYEKHFKAGGNLTGWDRNGYHIDNCIHWLTGTNPVTKLYGTWKDLGALGNVKMHRAETLYTFEKDGQSISLNRDLEQMKKDMLAVAPQDKKEILPFIRAIRAARRLYGITGKANEKKSSAAQKLLSVPILMRYYGMTTGMLSKRFSHPLLQGFIASFMTTEFSALALIIVFGTFCGENGDIPVGSSCAMARRITNRFLALGGTLCLKNGVTKINTKDDQAQSVTLEDGSTRQADYVIIATDPSVAFGKLLNKKLMPKALKKQYQDPKMQRFSSYHCAFSCNSAVLPFEHEIMLEIPDKYKSELHADYMMLREFSYEEGFAPKGKNLLQTMTYCFEKDACGFIQLSKDKTAYRQRKRRIAEITETIILEQFPVLREKLQCIDVWTPATYHKYVGTQVGSFMSFILPPNKLPLRQSNQVKGLKNVILASQWLQSPGGLPIAAEAGFYSIQTILKQEKRAGRSAPALS